MQRRISSQNHSLFREYQLNSEQKKIYRLVCLQKAIITALIDRRLLTRMTAMKYAIFVCLFKQTLRTHRE